MTDPGIAEPLRRAARAVLERDGVDLALRSWQAAYLIALAEGREGAVPVACGAGKGWLDARLSEALDEGDA